MKLWENKHKFQNTKDQIVMKLGICILKYYSISVGFFIWNEIMVWLCNSNIIDFHLI